MNIADTIQAIKQFDSENQLEVDLIRDRRLVVSVQPKMLKSLASYLYKKLHCRFVIASALQTKQGFEIYYHFSKDTNGLLINLHVLLPVNKAKIASLANLFFGANWIEREMHELYGIEFINHPNPDKLISDGNWAADYYPYRNENKNKPIP